MAKRFVALCASIGLAAACGGSVETTGTGGSTSSSSTGGGAASSDVHGTWVDHLHGEAKVVDLPFPLAGKTVAALVMEGGAYKTYPGSGAADGSFTIPSVPAGPFVLTVAGVYLYTSAREIDLGSDYVGLVDGPDVAGAGTKIGDELTGLLPWELGDNVLWFCPNAGGIGYGFSSGTAPDLGATSTSGLTTDWYGRLVSGAHGDVLYATQMRADASASVFTVGRVASFTGVEQIDQQVTPVSGALTDVPAGTSMTVDFRAAAFAAHGKEVNPGYMAYGAVFSLYTAPGAAEVGLVGATTDLFDVYAGEEDKVATALVSNPFPPAWGQVAYAGETFEMDYGAPGEPPGLSYYGSISVTMPPEDVAAGPITPKVTPVLSPTIDGKDLLAKVSGVSAQPTLAWKPPAIGAPTGYRVSISWLHGSGITTALDLEAHLFTTETSMVLPPGLLDAGKAYVIEIRAIVSPIDTARAPFRSSPRYALADVLSGVVTP